VPNHAHARSHLAKAQKEIKREEREKGEYTKIKKGKVGML